MGFTLEATRRRQDIKPLILAVFVIVMVRCLVTIEDNGTLLTRVILAAFLNVTCTALGGFHGLEPAGARQVLLRLKEDFQRQCHQSLGFEVTFSAGVFGGVLSRREDMELWREQADRLLYEAKRSGRNHIQLETT